MSRKSTATPIMDPTTGQPLTRPSAQAQTGHRHTSNASTDRKLTKSSVSAPEAHQEPGRIGKTLTRLDCSPRYNNRHLLSQHAHREAREAIMTLRLAPTPNANANANATATANRKVSAQASGQAQPSFNIYARPYIPKSLTIINSLPGHVVPTFPRKHVHYDAYATTAFGPAAGFLPSPSHPDPNTTLSEGPAAATPAMRQYAAFFQCLLQQEVDAQRFETDACSLYGHQVHIQPLNESQESGHRICTLQVPGLRENVPFVEEDDAVHLRQLAYDDGSGTLHGMADWLRLKEIFESNHLQPQPWQDPAPGWTQVVYHASVLGVVRATEMLHLRVAGLPLDIKPTERFNVQFQVPLERNLPMLFALSDAQQTLLHGGWISSMLFPSNSDADIQEKLHTGVWSQPFFDKDLNWEQKKTVESALLRTHGTLPYLISGPPGTGKTKTIIEIALQMVKSSKALNHILLCAPSDPAADTLCTRLQKYLAPVDMLRLNRSCRTFAEVPDFLLPYCCIDGDAFGLPPLETLMKFRVIVTTCRDSAMLVRARLTNRDICAIQRGIRGLTAVLTPYDRLPEIKLHWAGLLLDEAAQAMEPEALIPLTIVTPPVENDYNSSAPVVVMAGDEHQLGPKTVLPISPLRDSLFARLFKRPVYAGHPLARGKQGEAPPPLTKALLPVLRPAFANLIRNYRSHPAILAVPSNLFYWDTLEPEAKDADRLASWTGWQGRRWPVLFHDNQSLDDLELPGMMEGIGGWYNKGEAAVACGYARSLVHSGLVAQNEVCIMSPFRSQVRVLRETMRQHEHGAMWDVNIGPTEAFQGLEKGVVILCVTRARKNFVEEDQKFDWGIIGMPNKMNVALTRAKFGLIVVGNRDLLADDPNWNAFVRFCDRNGLVADPEAANGENGPGGAPLQEEKLTRHEKMVLERERCRQMSKARFFGSMGGGHQAGQELILPSPSDYDHDGHSHEDEKHAY